jgi:hypothetical protein
MTPKLAAAPAELVGSWRDGDVQFAIATDGRVSGAVAQTQLATAQLSRNRSWFGRWLGWRSEYIIRGRLTDSRTVSVPFDARDATLRGAVFVRDNAGRQRRTRVALVKGSGEESAP